MSMDCVVSVCLRRCLCECEALIAPKNKRSSFFFKWLCLMKLGILILEHLQCTLSHNEQKCRRSDQNPLNSRFLQNWREHLLHPVNTVIPSVHSCAVQPCISQLLLPIFFASRVVALGSSSGQIYRSHTDATLFFKVCHTHTSDICMGLF